MKKKVTFFSLALPLFFLVGCGGGGVEVGPPAEVPKTSVTPEFKAAMEKAGSNMMKKARPKEFTGIGKKGQ